MSKLFIGATILMFLVLAVGVAYMYYYEKSPRDSTSTWVKKNIKRIGLFMFATVCVWAVVSAAALYLL